MSLPPAGAVLSTETGGASRVLDNIVEWCIRAQLNDRLNSAGVFPVLPNCCSLRAEQALRE